VGDKCPFLWLCAVGSAPKHPPKLQESCSVSTIYIESLPVSSYPKQEVLVLILERKCKTVDDGAQDLQQLGHSVVVFRLQ
jgi:hypothetical protein